MFNFKKIIKIKNNQSENKKIFISSIINSSAPSLDFYLMVSLSALITSLGLLADSIALVIAGMIVAPLLSPLLATALSCSILNIRFFLRSLKIFLASIFVTILFSVLIGLIFNNYAITDLSLIEKMNISWLTFSIALIAGITASYAWTRPNSKDYLSGIAIAVTIIPPLASIGLSIASLDYNLFIKTSYFFLMNLIGIFLGGLLIFLLMNFYKVKKIVNKEIKKEENSEN